MTTAVICTIIMTIAIRLQRVSCERLCLAKLREKADRQSCYAQVDSTYFGSGVNFSGGMPTTTEQTINFFLKRRSLALELFNASYLKEIREGPAVVGIVRQEPGSLRQLHWHLEADEWQFGINGTLEVTCSCQADLL